MLDAGHSCPLAVDALGVDDGLDLFDGGKAGIPHGLCVVAAEVLDELGEVRSVTHVTCAVVAIESTPPTRRAPARPLSSGSLEQVGGGQPGDAGADDNGVDVEVTVERWIAAESTPCRSSMLWCRQLSIMHLADPPSLPTKQLPRQPLLRA